MVKLMMSGANTLILDEPTNHMDIESKEVFEEALKDFEGTDIIVSHDRYFLQKIPTRMFELTPEGIKEYLGKYDYYLEKKAQEEEALAMGSRGQDSFIQTSSKEERANKKAQEAEERRLRREIERLEKDIETKENRVAEIEELMQKPEYLTDFTKLTKLSEEMSKLKEDINESYEKWESLQVE